MHKWGLKFLLRFLHHTFRVVWGCGGCALLDLNLASDPTAYSAAAISALEISDTVLSSFATLS